MKLTLLVSLLFLPHYYIASLFEQGSNVPAEKFKLLSSKRYFKVVNSNLILRLTFLLTVYLISRHPGIVLRRNTACYVVVISFIYFDFVEMFRKIFAIVGAIIAGGLGVAILGTGTQVAHAGIQIN